MQILQWLFKTSGDHKRAATTRSRSKRELSAERDVASSDLVIYNRAGSCPSAREEFKCGEGEEETEKTFTIFLSRDDCRTCFYSTLYSKHLRNIYNNQNIWHPGKEVHSELGMGHKAESASVGCKVLPICDGGVLTGSSSSDGLDKDVHKGERRRAASRMKELIRWASASKSHKGASKSWKVLYFRNKVAMKGPLEDISSNSSKISFRWDVGSCSSSSSVYSPSSMASASKNDHRWAKNLSNPAANLQRSECDLDTQGSPKMEKCEKTGQWITTDSDFVVLEL